jgi:hypothetical protein
MPKTVSFKWYEEFQDKILASIDNLVATPFNNEQYIWDLEEKQAYPGADAAHPYPSINNSAHATLLKGSLVFATLFGIFFAFFVAFYKKIRKTESLSHYFFFEHLLRLIEKKEIETLLGKSSVPIDYLYAAAHFYNPDLPFVVRWIRQKWAALTKKAAFKNFECHLNNEIKYGKRTKAEVLNIAYKEIHEKIARFITKQEHYGKWAVEQQDKKWTINPAAEYHDLWFKTQLKTENEIQDKKTKNKKIVSYLECFIEARLQELGSASFVYWVGVFAFFFLPGVGICGGIIWPPIIIASVFLMTIWATKGYKLYKTNSKTGPGDKNNNDAMHPIDPLIEMVKCKILLDDFRAKRAKAELGCGKSPSKLNENKKPQLYREIKKVLNKKSDFLIIESIFNGFFSGCFTIYFSFWLLSSAVALFVVFNPIVTVALSLGTLSCGLMFGMYSAVKYYKREIKLLLVADAKLKLLEASCSIQIPNISLRECDRLFRRGTIDSTCWTTTKQFCKRSWIGFIRIGTGMLFLKLLPLGTLTTVLSFLGFSGIIPTFFPMLLILFTGGLVFSTWYVSQYNSIGEESRALKIMNFLLMQSNLANIRNEPPICKNKESKISKVTNQIISTPIAVLNQNEDAFRMIIYCSSGSYSPDSSVKLGQRFLSKRRNKNLKSNSTSNLHKIIAFSAEKNDHNLEPIARKRSNTLPPCYQRSNPRLEKNKFDETSRFTLFNQSNQSANKAMNKAFKRVAACRV